LLLNYNIGAVGDSYDILTVEPVGTADKLKELLKNLIDFVILPKSSMPAFVSIVLTLLSAGIIYLLAPGDKLWLKIIFTCSCVLVFVGVIPALIFVYKGTYEALRPQALIGMYFTPALLVGSRVGKRGLFMSNASDFFNKANLFWIITFFLIGIQSFQISSTLTSKQAAYEKDIITGQAIVSDLMNFSSDPSSMKVNILLAEDPLINYFPKRTYYSAPSNRWSGISDCHVFDCQPSRIPHLLKLVAPSQVRLTAQNIKSDNSLLEEFKISLEEIPSWGTSIKRDKRH
jgi:hypothetical protein